MSPTYKERLLEQILTETRRGNDLIERLVKALEPKSALAGGGPFVDTTRVVVTRTGDPVYPFVTACEASTAYRGPNGEIRIGHKVDPHA